MYDPSEPYSEYALHIGIVQDDKDPLLEGRVFVNIAGLLEPGAWADVVMTGSPYNRGNFFTPVIGGQVVVGFLQGDYEHPIILGGLAPPMLAGGARAGTEDEDNPKFVRMENEDWVFVLGKKGTVAPYAAIYSRETETEDPEQADTKRTAIVLDLDTGAIEIKAPVSLKLKTKGTLALEGNVVTINGRPVSRNNQPM